MPEVDLKPIEEMFRASVLKMFKEEGKIGDDLINKLMSWKPSLRGVGPTGRRLA